MANTNREKFRKMADQAMEDGRIIEACIFFAESRNDRTNWKAKPKPPLGRIVRLNTEKEI